MLGDQKLKEKLIFCYEVSTLYVDSMASATVIGELAEIPRATVKRSINTIKEKIDDYIRLLPDLASEEELLKLQEKIEQQKKENHDISRYAYNPGLLANFEARLEKIKKLYQNIRPLSDEEIRINILNLRLNGLSMGKIATATGISVGRVHKIINNNKSK